MSEGIDSSGSVKRISRGDILFLAGTFSFLYTQLFQLPFTPYYFDGDQMISLSNAMRLLNGEVIYRDFFHLTTPGAEVVYASLFAIFGVKVWGLNFVVLVLVFAIATLTWHLSRYVLTGVFVYLPSALLMVVGFRQFFNDGSYRLFSIVCVLAAVAVLMKQRTSRAVIFAGALCGLASFFVQTRGVLAIGGILAFIIWEGYRNHSGVGEIVKKAALLFAAFLFVAAGTNAYFLWQAGFDNYYFSVVTFAQNHYRHEPLATSLAFLADVPSLELYLEIFSPLTAISRFVRVAGPLLFFYFIPISYLIFLLARILRRDRSGSAALDSRLMLLCFAGLGLLAGISGPSGYRFAHVSMTATIIAVWLFEQVRHSRLLAAIALSILTLVGISYAIQRQTIEKYFLDLPAGRSAFLSKPTFEKYEWIGEHTRPGDLFFEGFTPSFYFPFHLVNPTPMYLIRDSDYSPKFQIDSVVAALRKNPPRIIVWPKKWGKKREERLPGDHLDPLWQFLITNYQLEKEFLAPPDSYPYTVGDIGVWRHRDEVSSFEDR